jgi:hypothetical protein
VSYGKVHRSDANTKRIAAALRKAGAKVKDTGQVGDGFGDLVVGYAGEIHILEIKDGSKPLSKQRLTPAEKKFHAEWAGYSVHIVGSIDEALGAVGII